MLYTGTWYLHILQYSCIHSLVLVYRCCSLRNPISMHVLAGTAHQGEGGEHWSCFPSFDPCVLQQSSVTPTGGPSAGSGGHGERGVGPAGLVVSRATQLGWRGGEAGRRRYRTDGKAFLLLLLQTRNFPPVLIARVCSTIPFHFHVANKPRKKTHRMVGTWQYHIMQYDFLPLWVIIIELYVQQ